LDHEATKVTKHQHEEHEGVTRRIASWSSRFRRRRFALLRDFVFQTPWPQNSDRTLRGDGDRQISSR